VVVQSSFLRVGSASRDDADQIFPISIAVADHQSPQQGAEAEQQEPVLAFRVLGIRHEESVVV